MPRLKSANTLRPDLGAVAIEYALEASQRGFIGVEVMPVFETPEQSGEYPVIPVESLLKLQDTKRAARSAYGRSDYEFESADFACKEDGWEEPVDDGEAKMYATYFDAEELAVQRALDVVLRAQEKRIATAVMNTTNFSVNNVSVKWTAPATAVPRANIKAARTALRNATGLEGNAVILSLDTFENAMLCAEFLDHVKYTNPVLLENFETQKKLMALYLGIDRVLVGNASYDAGKKGQALSATAIWPTAYGMVAQIGTNAQDLREPCLGRSFLWTADTPDNVVVEQYREDQTRSDIYRVRQYMDEKFVCIAAGYLLGNLA